MRIASAIVFSYASLFATAATADLPRVHTVGFQLDVAREIAFKSKNPCPPPRKGALRSFRGVKTFTLEHGDIGKCSGDDRPKKSFSPVAPYIERSEIPSRDLKKGNRYLISAYVHFDPEFASSRDTTIIQVSQWQADVCECGAFVKISLDRQGDLYASVLKGHYRYEDYRLGGWNRQHFEDKWVEIAIDLDTGDPGRAAVYIAGRPIISVPMHVQEGNRVVPKFGLYRPGAETETLPTDRVHIKNVRYLRLKRNP